MNFNLVCVQSDDVCGKFKSGQIFCKHTFNKLHESGNKPDINICLYFKL